MRRGDPIRTVKQIAQMIYDKKGGNIIALDVRNTSSMTDYLLIAEGMVDRHVIALAQEVVQELKKEGETPQQVEGLETGDWVVLDYLDFMVHLFQPGLREKYRLEELFQEGKILDLDIQS